jgi:hypothetical protein
MFALEVQEEVVGAAAGGSAGSEWDDVVSSTLTATVFSQLKLEVG